MIAVGREECHALDEGAHVRYIQVELEQREARAGDEAGPGGERTEGVLQRGRKGREGEMEGLMSESAKGKMHSTGTLLRVQDNG